jgi:hypothetical protein
MRSSKKRSFQKLPIGKRGASKKGSAFKMPKVKKVGVKKFALHKSPSKKASPKVKKSRSYKGVAVSKLYGD